MIRIKIKPVPKPRMTHSDRWRKRPCVLRYFEFKDNLSKFIESLPEILSVTFVLPMPESWSKKKKDKMRGQPHRQRPDLDNLIKSLQDSLLDEDSNIWKYQSCQKIWGDEGEIIIY